MLFGHEKRDEFHKARAGDEKLNIEFQGPKVPLCLQCIPLCLLFNRYLKAHAI